VVGQKETKNIYLGLVRNVIAGNRAFSIQA